MSMDTVDDLHHAEDHLSAEQRATYCRPTCQAEGDPNYDPDHDPTCGCPCHERGATDAAVVDAIADLLRAEEWPGASGMEDIAALVALVRNVDPVPGAEWPRH